MFGSLVRWFGSGARSGRSGRGSGSAQRFTPQTETLETRALPGGMPGGVVWAPVAQPVLLSDRASSPTHVSLPGSVPASAGVLHHLVTSITRSSGEEIPQ
jgi:hypothetical protein